jgi:small ligand-binding sensory domain FIST
MSTLISFGRGAEAGGDHTAAPQGFSTAEPTTRRGTTRASAVFATIGRVAAKSFLADAEGFERALAAARASVGKPAGALLFASGAAAQAAPRIAEVAAKSLRGAPFCVVPSAGVITERGEVEAAAAIAGLVWSDGAAKALAFDEGDDAAAAVAAAFDGKPGTAVLFGASPLAAATLGAARERAPKVTQLGAGTVGAPAIACDEYGQRVRGALCAGLGLRSLAPLVRATSACRLLSALEPIDEVIDGLVTRVGGVPALDRLSASATTTTSKGGVAAPHPVVFAALAEADDAEPEASFVVRPLRGIDPTRRAVMVPEAKVGMKLGFAVRDAATARAGLEASGRKLAADATGSAPRFALLLTCAGRGQGLYGARDVESRIVRQRFGDLPFAGMHSAFELVPRGAGAPDLAMYAALLALFRAPS